MASPFHYFRKNQKLFLVVAAGLAMFVFVIADPLSNLIQQWAGVTPQQSGKKVVALWDGGSINERELSDLTRRRYFISGFLRNLQGLGARRIIDEGGTPTQPTVPNFILNENPAPGSVEANVVTGKIFAELSQEAGISISPKLINHYLNEIGFRRVTGDEIRKLLAVSQREGGVRGAEELLFSGLSEMLLGEYYLNSYSSAIRNVLPEQRWQDWLQINERIALEAAILPAEQFLAKTEDPSDDDLKKFYDINKDRVEGTFQLVAGVPLPSPEAGFREPRRVKIQYLLGDVTAWTEKLLDTVTDEEIADYYERNKRSQFVKISDNSATLETQEEEAEESDTPADKSEKAEEAPEKETTEPAKSADAEKPAEKSKESPAEPTEKADTPSSESEESAEKPADDKSGSVLTQSPFRLTAFQDKGESEGEDESKSEDEAKPSEEDSAETKPSDDDSADNPKESTEDTPSEKSDDDTATEDEEQLEYVSLESVSDEIRRQLANDKAVVELKRVMEFAYADLQSEYNTYGGQVITAESQDKEPPAVPTKLANLSGMAKKHGLAHESTTSLSGRELSETFVGKAVDIQTGRLTVTRAAFTSMVLHEPFLAQDIDGQWYLVLKTEDKTSYIPELADIREKVVAAWKQNEAAKIALETSKTLAKEAQEAGGQLATFLADKGYEVVTTDLFSARTFGTTPMEMRAGARLSDAPPLTAIGLEFMDEAFQLKAEEVVALQSNDHSNAYVVRLDRREKTKEELKNLFLREANNWYGSRMMMFARWQHAQQQLQQQLHKRIGLNLEELTEYLQGISSR